LVTPRSPGWSAAPIPPRPTSESLHPDILDAVGVALAPIWRKDRSRDPQFRGRLLVAYEYR
jgi:hypothetical protein